MIVDPDDASPQGQFEKMLDSFLTGKVQARHKDEIMNAKPYHDPDEKKVYFRSEDLFVYLTIMESIKKHFSRTPPKQGKTMICQKL